MMRISWLIISFWSSLAFVLRWANLSFCFSIAEQLVEDLFYFASSSPAAFSRSKLSPSSLFEPKRNSPFLPSNYSVDKSFPKSASQSNFGLGCLRKMEQDGNAFKIYSATDVFANNINSSTMRFVSRN